MKKERTSLVFTGDIGFDRYMDRKWEDESLCCHNPFWISSTVLTTRLPTRKGAVMDIVNDGSRGAYFHTIDPKATTVLNKIHADIRNIGNNHSMDVGKDGMLSTKAFATQDVWDAYFRGKPEGFFAGEHMDFSHLVPLAAKA